METFMKELRTRLEEDLNAIPVETNPIMGYDKRIELVEVAISRLKEYLLQHPFADREIEIQYFKYWALPFIKSYFYYIKVYSLELIRSTCDREQLLEHLENEKKSITAAFGKHQELYRYYLAGRSDEDDKFFIFRLPSRTTHFLTADNSFCRATLVLGKLLAYDEYRIILNNEIEGLKNHNFSGKRIELKVPKAAVAEFIAPIWELQWIWIDGRPATLGELIKMVERGLHIDMKDFSVIDNINRYRKKSANPYLHQVLQFSNSRRERLDP